MNIIEKTYTLNGPLEKRSKTDTIILHHRVGDGDIESIDAMHKNQGFTCIGYHFYVRKDGSTYRGREEDKIGAHAYGSNNTSIGICAEGNFEVETMPEVQKQAIIELINYIKGIYLITRIVGHRGVNATACPGKNYPLDEIINGQAIPTKPEVTGKIADIQRKLNERYGFNIAVDNLYGNETRTALVKALQAEYNKQFNAGLVVDGIFGAKTKSACRNIKQGHSGNITWLIQAMLLCKGYTIDVDGIYGANTTATVKTMQSRNKLSVDGIAGKNTQEKLFK